MHENASKILPDIIIPNIWVKKHIVEENNFYAVTYFCFEAKIELYYQQRPILRNILLKLC